MGSIVQIACSLFLVFALTAGLLYHLAHSRAQLANADDPRPPGRPLGLVATLIAIGALVSFLVLLLAL